MAALLIACAIQSLPATILPFLELPSKANSPRGKPKRIDWTTFALKLSDCWLHGSTHRILNLPITTTTKKLPKILKTALLVKLPRRPT